MGDMAEYFLASHIDHELQYDDDEPDFYRRKPNSSWTQQLAEHKHECIKNEANSSMVIDQDSEELDISAMKSAGSKHKKLSRGPDSVMCDISNMKGSGSIHKSKNIEPTLDEFGGLPYAGE